MPNRRGITVHRDRPLVIRRIVSLTEGNYAYVEEVRRPGPAPSADTELEDQDQGSPDWLTDSPDDLGDVDFVTHADSDSTPARLAAMLRGAPALATLVWSSLALQVATFTVPIYFVTDDGQIFTGSDALPFAYDNVQTSTRSPIAFVAFRRVTFSDGERYVSTCTNPGCTGLQAADHAHKFFGTCVAADCSAFCSGDELPVDGHHVCPCGLAVMALSGGEQHFTTLLRSAGSADGASGASLTAARLRQYTHLTTYLLLQSPRPHTSK